jgi:protocatechuate 3,4-dioxygenase beta subunit
MRHRLIVLISMLVLAVSAGVAQQQPNQTQARRPARDSASTPQGTASIAGRVLSVDTGRPVKRARVIASAGGGQSRAESTDDQGRFRFGGLPAGAYTIRASKSGFVEAIYGQRRPLQPGTAVQLADGQALAAVDFRLIRGAVITGRILDEDGEPLVRALVSVERYQYVRGERQLTAAGGDQTDDRGQYRIFGLPPGEYYVSASTTTLAQQLGRGFQVAIAGVTGGRGGGRGGFGIAPAQDADPTGYAPTYYPGAITAADATKLTVAPGQELGGIDFQVQLVAMSTVRGFVMGADGPASVLLAPQESNGGRRGRILRTGSEADGSFMIANVPPGHYTAVARSGGRGGTPRMGTLSVNVTGENISGVTIALQAGISMSGYITVESAGTPSPTDYSTFRVDAPEVSPLPFGGGPGGTGARAEKNGRFQIDNLFPGEHYVRVSGQGAWTLKSISIAGRDVTDDTIDLHAGQSLDNLTVVLTDRTTAVDGTVRDGSGTPLPALTVVAFSSDPQYWRPQSRQIQAVRTDQSGVFHLRNLPPGEYELAVVDSVEQGEWFDPSFLQQIRSGAKRLTLSEGETKTQDLTGPGL